MKANETLTYQTFVPALLVEVPEFQPFYDEYVRDQHGDSLPHVLMPDLARFLIDAYRKSISGAWDAAEWGHVVERSLIFLERAFTSSDPLVPELINVSFLVYLDWAEADYEGIKSLLGPQLREQVHAIETWQPSFLDSL